MSATTPNRAQAGVTDARTTDAPRTLSTLARYMLVALRLSIGWVFLWAFLDKTFGLGYATPAENAWVEGGSPTTGYLSNAPTGPFAGFYNDLAGQAWVDWLFQITLLLVGVALILGIGMWLSAIGGGLLLVMMWTASLPPENNPFMDDHIVYTFVLVLLAAVGAGRILGLGDWWQKLDVVQRFPILK